MLITALLLLFLRALWGRHVFKIYVCRSHSSNTALTGQTELPAVLHVYSTEAVFPALQVDGRGNVLPPKIQQIEVQMGTLLCFINAAGQALAPTTAGGNVLFSDTKLR